MPSSLGIGGIFFTIYFCKNNFPPIAVKLKIKYNKSITQFWATPNLGGKNVKI